MKAVRLEIHQNSANYKKEETVDNCMTHPLPPVSTVIGLIHNACSYTTYHKMDISIQGKFDSMTSKLFTHHCFLDGYFDDRGILVKMNNENILNSGFTKVAECKKSRGSSFKNEKFIHVYNQKLWKEFRDLKGFDIQVEDNSPNKVIKRNLNDDLLSKYRLLIIGIKRYEILNNIDLVIHIKSDEETLNDILKNIYNMKSLGRSEDFIHVTNAEIVELYEGECDIESSLSRYIGCEDIKKGYIFVKSKDGQAVNGTKYYINKYYDVDKCKATGKRIFTRQPVLYTSYCCIDETSENIFVDKVVKNTSNNSDRNINEDSYIVCFIHSKEDDIK